MKIVYGSMYSLLMFMFNVYIIDLVFVYEGRG